MKPCACDESPVDFDHNYPDCKVEIERLRAEVKRLRALCSEAAGYLHNAKGEYQFELTAMAEKLEAAAGRGEGKV